MGILDRIQQSAARSAAARQGGASRSGRGAGRGGRSSRRRVPSPPLDAQERRTGYLIALATLVAFVAIWAPHLGQVVQKKGIKPIEELGIGALMAALIVWSSLLKRRWLLALVSFYVGLVGPWGTFRYVGYALMAAGAWFLYRNAKLQADAQRSAVAADPRSSGGASGARSSRPGAAQPSSGVPHRSGGRGVARARDAAGGPAPAGARRAGARAAKQPKVDETGRPIPPRSKRYTPPQAPSKGDRRERRERRESVRSAGGNRSDAPKV